jgi:hypothetical protein
LVVINQSSTTFRREGVQVTHGAVANEIPPERIEPQNQCVVASAVNIGYLVGIEMSVTYSGVDLYLCVPFVGTPYMSASILRKDAVNSIEIRMQHEFVASQRMNVFYFVALDAGNVVSAFSRLKFAEPAVESATLAVERSRSDVELEAGTRGQMIVHVILAAPCVDARYFYCVQVFKRRAIAPVDPPPPALSTTRAMSDADAARYTARWHVEEVC